ncbi:hypothetical protein C4J99_3831 [Pseudomonas synxantha]|nr:hypothetical protein C4J99_3831 [Pseudomonas synxantha]
MASVRILSLFRQRLLQTRKFHGKDGRCFHFTELHGVDLGIGDV